MMKTILAALFLSCLLPCLSFAQPAQPQAPENKRSPVRGSQEAARMTPARVALLRSLNTAKDRPGTLFQTKLAKAVLLKNGSSLPAGTMLIGTTAVDDMNLNGRCKLALRFTQAQLKDGTDIPIKATIVAYYRPAPTPHGGYPVEPGDQYPNGWNAGTLQVNELDVDSGVDLHSKISSKNSGVFVSRTKDNFTLASGSELALAIAASPRHQTGF